MFYRHDTRLFSWLFNIYRHLQDNYDFLLIVVGDTGTGKSMFALHLLEAWYRVVLGRSVEVGLIKNFNVDFKKWAIRFKELEPFEMNVFDEGSTALDSKDYLSGLSKDLSKLFNVIRYKRVFSVVVLPNFFGLNKYFRENRLRGLVHVNKRGQYRLFSKVGINFLNAFNERRLVKSMFVARPVHSSVFPDYKGVLRSAYDSVSFVEKDRIVDELVGRVDGGVRLGVFELYGSKVARLVRRGLSRSAIAESLGLSVGSVQNVVVALRGRGLLD